MGVYLRAKPEVSSVILTSFRLGGEGGVILPPSPLPHTSKQTPKKSTQIRVNTQFLNMFYIHISLTVQLF